MYEKYFPTCAGLELQNGRKDEEIVRLETQLKELTARLKELKQSHKVDLQEANVRLQQEMYLARQFRHSSSGTAASRDIPGKPKHQHQRGKPKSKS